MAKRKRTNDDIPNIKQKTKDRATRTPLKTGVNSGAPEGWVCSLRKTRIGNLLCYPTMCYNKLVSKARKKWLQLSAIIYNTSNGDVRRLYY
jgi:hypothetical protein